MVVHHKKQLCEGGTNEPDNLVTLCYRCHNEYHEHCDTEDFDTWRQKPPFWIYSAIANGRNIGMIDKDGMDKAMSSMEEWWPIIADARMVRTPMEHEDYVKKNSSSWIDW